MEVSLLFAFIFSSSEELLPFVVLPEWVRSHPLLKSGFSPIDRVNFEVVSLLWW